MLSRLREIVEAEIRNRELETKSLPSLKPSQKNENKILVVTQEVANPLTAP